MKVELAQGSSDINACMELRRTVFVREQGISEEEEFDTEENNCTYVIAKEGDMPVGTARYQLTLDTAKIQRVCVPIEFRGKQIGATIIAFIIDQVRADAQVQYIRLSAQTHAVEFYEKHGFKSFGPVYPDANIPHIDMELTI